MSVGSIAPISFTTIASPSSVSQPGTGNDSSSSFIDLANSALQNVSSAQGAASTAEASYSAGVPGATLANALVTSDRAETAWNATVSVRNEAVSAYQSIMNMQF